VKIKFSTDNKVVLDHFRIIPAKKSIPDWYKNLETYMNEGKDSLDTMIENSGVHKTIKACVPVLDYLTSGYMIKSTIHMKIKNNNTEKESGISYMTSDTTMVGTHSHKQCPVHIEGEKKTYFKFNSPWTITTPKGYSCLFYQPFYENLDPSFRLMPAIVDTDTYDKPINFPGYITKNREVEIMPGNTLMCVFPFKRETWSSDIVLEEKKKSLFDHFIHGAYRKVFWRQKIYK